MIWISVAIVIMAVFLFFGLNPEYWSAIVRWFDRISGRKRWIVVDEDSTTAPVSRRTAEDFQAIFGGRIIHEDDRNKREKQS